MPDVRMKRLIALGSMLLLAFSCIYAQSFVITDYIFITDGKTNPIFLKRIIAAEDTYQSVQEFEDALKYKRQRLLGTRVFKDIEVSYTLDQNNEAEVTFTLEEAFSSFGLPSAGYDSNTGFAASIDIEDRNLFGTLSDFLFHVGGSFKSNDHSTDYLGFDIRLDSMQLGFGTLNSRIAVSKGVENKLLDTISLKFDLKDTKTRYVALSNTLEVNMIPTSGEFFSVDWRLLKLKDSLNLAFHDTIWKNHGLHVGLDLEGSEPGNPLETPGGLASISLEVGPTYSFSEHTLRIGEYAAFDIGSNSLSFFTKTSMRYATQDVSWEENFRDGYALVGEIGVSVPHSSDFLDPDAYVLASADFYTILGDRFNSIVRVAAAVSNKKIKPLNQSADLSKYIRGILDVYDEEVNNSHTLILFANTSVMSYLFNCLGCNVYLNPFVDVALYADASAGILGGFGIESIFILDSFPGFPLIVSFGLNMNELLKGQVVPEVSVQSAFFV